MDNLGFIKYIDQQARGSHLNFCSLFSVLYLPEKGDHDFFVFEAEYHVAQASHEPTM